MEKRATTTDRGVKAERPGLLERFGFLARRAVGGVQTEQAAYEALLESCWDALWRYAYHTTGNVHDAGDLLSEATLEGFRGFAQFRGETTFLRWMYRVMTTTHIDMLRRNRRHLAQSLEALSEREGGDFDIPDEAADPEKIVLEPMLSEPVQEALNALHEEFRRVVVLADIEQLDYAEISQVLQIPIGTVRSRLHRARGILRKSLATYVEENRVSEGRGNALESRERQ